MTPDELLAELDSGTVRPAYLVVGEETLYRDDAQAAIRSAVLSSGPVDFNIEKLGADASPGELIDAMQTLPVMAPYRLVLLRNPEGVRGGARALTDALGTVVGEIGADGASAGSAVLVVNTPKVDRRSRWVKAFARSAIVACEPPKRSRDVVDFIRAEASRQDVTLGRGVAEALAERVGPQLLVLRQEIAKAALLAGEGQSVNTAHVAAGSIDVAEESIWDLTDAIGEGRCADALSVLAKLTRAGAPAPVVLGSLVSHFRRLLRVRSGVPPQGPPFVKKKLEGQARRYTSRRLLACLRAIHQTDTAIKGAGALRPETALERLVIGLAG